MEKEELSAIQKMISDALESMKEKSLVTEANLSKKLRLIAKIEGKNKACISLEDLEKVLEYLSSNDLAIFSVSLNSVNEFLLKKDLESKKLDLYERKRRQSSEKSKTIFTNSDLNEKKDSKKIKAIKNKSKIRTKTEKINIYSNFEDLD